MRNSQSGLFASLPGQPPAFDQGLGPLVRSSWSSSSSLLRTWSASRCTPGSRKGLRPFRNRMKNTASMAINAVLRSNIVARYDPSSGREEEEMQAIFLFWFVFGALAGMAALPHLQRIAAQVRRTLAELDQPKQTNSGS